MSHNITPSTLEKSTSTIPLKILSTPKDLKRNLDEVFDVDNNAKSSSTKCPRLSWGNKEHEN